MGVDDDRHNTGARGLRADGAEVPFVGGPVAGARAVLRPEVPVPQGAERQDRLLEIVTVKVKLNPKCSLLRYH